ncbi:ATP-binding protein [Deinococcus sp. AJ005]|uniref:sensor histidine kinase n=1 Tax=Deinococcus sp. AJ005 TaxID=2652443 RepID=UPI00125CAEAC|nr:ATP-binding protein [Deinococcus sp. AJ005]QFP77452.1 hypothetical protein DAAJ005_14015 [Deinococcus sp. AJ005]
MPKPTGLVAGSPSLHGELAQDAEQVSSQNIPDLKAGYYERQGEHWVALVTTDGVPPDLLNLIQGGLPLDTPCFAQTVAARTPQFFDHWDAAEQGIPFTETFHAAGLAPFFRRGQPVAMLAVGLESTEVWTTQQQHLFKAVYHALDSAQKRSDLAQIHNRQLALEAFVQLTEAIGTETDPLRLAERARDLLWVAMPEWSVGYYEWHAGLWCALLADVPDPELRASLFAGLPDTTPGYRAAVKAQGPVFFSRWNAQEQAFPLTESYGAAAFAPYFRDGLPAAMFVIGSQVVQDWLPADQAVFEAVERSLGLALERSWQTQALESRTQELQASAALLLRSNQGLKAVNGELEAFVYSASHDLRTPVRHVMGFVEMTRRALASGHPEKAERSLVVVEQAAGQMNRMIDAMLALSRSTQEPHAHTEVNLSVLVERARRNVDDEGRQIEWRVEPLPQVMGDPVTLQQVMINLLSNAVKFTRPREQAIIEIGTRAGPTAWTVWVRDNGVGFDPAYAGKLFTPFQRLHAHSEFEGTGIGLATVRRIILRHGGRVWAESVLDEGTTVSFTLPHLRPLELGDGEPG